MAYLASPPSIQVDAYNSDLEKQLENTLEVPPSHEGLAFEMQTAQEGLFWYGEIVPEDFQLAGQGRARPLLRCHDRHPKGLAVGAQFEVGL